MHKCKNWWHTLSRKQKVGAFLLGIGLCVLFLYLYCGCPAFTKEQQFRRAEKADLIGPAAILGMEEVQMQNYTQTVIVAEDAESVTLFGCGDSGHLLHREKTGDLTIVVWPNTPDISPSPSFEMPIFLYDDFPEAKRAELEMTLTWDAFFSRDYFVEAKREKAGYFRFDITCAGTEVTEDTSGVSMDDKEISLLFSLALASDYNQGTSRAQFPINVRLYNNLDELICEQTLTVQSAAMDAHLRHGDPLE